MPVIETRSSSGTKSEYYAGLQAVRDDGAWEAWVLYMLRAVEQTSHTTLALVEGIRQQMADVKKRLKSESHLCSQDLINVLFLHPYTRIDFVARDLKVSRPTAAKHLATLAKKGFVTRLKSGRTLYFVNMELVELFLRVSAHP